MKIETKNMGKGSERTVEVPCRKCDECRQMQIRHWTGRILAELQDGGTPWFVTLTYGGGYDNGKAYWLDYSDIQKFFKNLRKAGFKFRYIIVGEYGSERARAHWHLLIIWDGAEPVAEFSKQEYTWPHWEHGTSYIERPRNVQATSSYIMKYMLKDPTAQIRYSKKPAFGNNYLMEYARKHAREGVGLFQTGATFTVPGNNNKSGKPFFYHVDRHSSLYERMIDAYLDEWAHCRPQQQIPLNERLQEHIEDILQGPVASSTVLAEYLEHVYDVHKIPRQNEFTVHTLYNGFIAITYEAFAIVEKRREGKVIWQKAVPKTVPSDHRQMSPDLRRLLIRELKQSPEFVQKAFGSERRGPNSHRPQRENHHSQQHRPEGGPGENLQFPP